MEDQIQSALLFDKISLCLYLDAQSTYVVSLYW